MIRIVKSLALAVALVLLAVAVMLLPGCGGGAEGSASGQPQAAQPRAAAATLTAAQLMDWAETQYPQYFPAAGRSAGFQTPYSYRYYAATGNYLGISTESADVAIYVYGNLNGWQVQRIASLSEYTCTVLPQSCTGPANTAGLYCGYSASVYSTSAQLTSTVSFSCSSSNRVMLANGVPDHTAGPFPTPANPFAISTQSHTFTATLTPEVAGSHTELSSGSIGYAINGVPFFPSASSSWGNEDVWHIEAIQDYSDLGMDASNAHVQPNGSYHYHGMPEGYLSKLNNGQAMTLVGFAKDGFPVYARYGYTTASDTASAIKVIRSSWRLKTSPGTGRPSNTTDVPMGTFTEDYEYVEGYGDLDRCNGRYGTTPEFPSGVYHYYITDSWPFIQRCVWGTVTTTGGGPR
jgi:hypothetical protein